MEMKEPVTGGKPGPEDDQAGRMIDSESAYVFLRLDRLVPASTYSSILS